jgi:hypothetical protein
VPASVGAELSLSASTLQDLLRQVLAKGKPFRFTAKGHSMIPFIWEGDVICIVPLRGGRISLGSVVAFVHPQHERLTVHRVVARQGEAYWIQADNSIGVADGLVSGDQILGQVTRVERHGRRVRYGLGLERYAIALLSRNGLLLPVYRRLMWLLKLFRRGSGG